LEVGGVALGRGLVSDGGMGPILSGFVGHAEVEIGVGTGGVSGDGFAAFSEGRIKLASGEK
jgi:hypothetical protein